MREKSRDMNDRIQGILASIRTKQLRRLIIYALFLILSQVSFNKSINHLIIRGKQSLRVFILQNAAVSYISPTRFNAIILLSDFFLFFLTLNNI